MPDIADPLVRGLLAGMQFTQAFRNARRQQEELAMRKQVLEESRAQRQRQNELQDLQTRLALATNPALEQVTGGSRKVTASVPPEMQSPVGLGSTVSMEAPVENPITYQGQSYAVRGPQERLNERIQQEMVLAGAKRRNTEAGWIPFTTPGGQTFRVPPQSYGTTHKALYPEKVPGRDIPFPEEVEAQRKRLIPPRPANTRYFIDPKGNVTGLERTPEGLNVLSGEETQGIAQPQQPAGGAGALSRERFEFTKAEAARKEQEAEEAKATAAMEALQKEEDPYHATREQLGQLNASKTLDDKGLADAVSRFKAATTRIQGIQYRKGKLLGAKEPVKGFVDLLKDGESRAAPDGATWRKEDGILYIVEGPRKNQASQRQYEIPEGPMPYTPRAASATANPNANPYR